MLITSQDGRLYLASATGQNVTDLNLPIDACTDGERGLLGVAVDPDFGSPSGDSDFVYLYYTRATGDGCANRVSRFPLRADDTLGQEQVLIDNIASPVPNHNAGDLHFGRDELLYISVGDGGQDLQTPENVQDRNGNARRLDILNGKILRIERDGGIPPSNPFTGDGTRRCNAGAATQRASKGVTAEARRHHNHKQKQKHKHKHKHRKRQRRDDHHGTPPGPVCQEIFATGLRNPFRFAFDPNDTAGAQRFFINDVGGSAWEEIDEGKAGADYGWNVREGPCQVGRTANCSPNPDNRFARPIFAYDRGAGCRTITGGAFVPDDAPGWRPAYDGAYLFADLGCATIFALRESPTGAVAEPFATGITAVHMAFGPDGALYCATYDDGGQVRKRVPPTG
jgi:glucose/arabinose dehydrogenase